MKRLFRIATAAGAALAVLAFVSVGADASVGSGKPNPCKLLKTKEIAKVLGQDTGKGKKDLTTPVSRQCKWEVQPGGEFPDGVIAVLVQTVGAKIAYDTNSKDPNVVKVSGLGKAYYDERLDAVTVLKGGVLLNVQGVFISTEGGVTKIHRQDALVALAKIAKRRV